MIDCLMLARRIRRGYVPTRDEVEALARHVLKADLEHLELAATQENTEASLILHTRALNALAKRRTQ